MRHLLFNTKNIFVLAMITFGLFFNPVNPKAQTYQLEGRVMYDNLIMADDAVVSLLNPDDSTMIQSLITDEDGKFTIKDIPAGTYLIAIQVFGSTDRFYGPVTLTAKGSKMVLQPIYLNTPSINQKAVISSSRS